MYKNYNKFLCNKKRKNWNTPDIKLASVQESF